MRVLKIIVSSILLLVWLFATLVLGALAILMVFPALMILFFPELMLLWCLPAGFLLIFGGWFSEEQVKAWFENDEAEEAEEDAG
tara:strand:+ start:6524 stop:6775 length:252 start_codon:yes stop_codon:yes gene_type:complete